MIFRAIALAALLVAPASALTDKTYETCEALSLYGELYATARQEGVPMAKAMRSARDVDDPEMRELQQAMVEDAYRMGRAGSEEMRQWQIRQFTDDFYTACLVMFRE